MQSVSRSGLRIIRVKDPSEGEKFAKKFLYENCDEQTVLFLSGGKTPKSLYDQLLSENKLKYGAVGMIDERYGEVGHEGSNANIMKGFRPFYPILNGESLKNTALQYDKTVRSLFARFQKSIGVLGVGSDGHTAGLPAGNQKLIRSASSGQEIKSQKENEFVTFVEDFPEDNPRRVTMTFAAISRLDRILILVFGEDLPAGRQGKKEALAKMFAKDPLQGDALQIEEIPARFYLQPEISQKSILVTDQVV